ncbi:choloylglycine hydrolase family protein [Erysipelothrix urinaevulpis]|uniref:choloylglycine hydrolase family protein n=1 Tax=Erysipelothrix urinaevulpis TaxID=2683717 RepID=UPI001358A81D|nr:choloylglycine hydrolase family protein [Erysipelothrix urinaevulpis]
MCTSITLKTKNNQHLLARTMDFSFELEPEMAMMPRHYPMNFHFMEQPLADHYAILGLSKKLNTHFMADGVNEKGLSGATLYFEDYAHYISQDDIDENKIQLGPIEFLMYVLATCETIENIIELEKNVQIVDLFVDFIQRTPPLHWVFVDQSGRSIIIEPRTDGLRIFENNLGILANSPDYEWHLTNIRNYINLSQSSYGPKTIYGQEFKPFGQGSGTFGLPGDLTPPSRFVRALYSKLSTKLPDNPTDLVIAASHVLNSVDIPKGSVVTQRGTLDYTQYTSYLSLSDLAYYYRLYNSFEIVKCTFDYDRIDEDEIILY